MSRYIIIRILKFIPSLLIITLLAFIISVNAPGDPMERILSSSDDQLSRSAYSAEQLAFWYNKTGLNLPLFYFSLHSLATSDAIYKLYNKSEKEILERLTRKYGNGNAAASYVHSVSEFKDYLTSKNFSLKGNLISHINFLQKSYDDEKIKAGIDLLIKNSKSDAQLFSMANSINIKYEALKKNATKWKSYIPFIRIHADNQYHRWLFGSEYSKGIIRGDFGISYITRQPVSEIIGKKTGWSVFMAFLSIVLAAVISIPAGIQAAIHKDSLYDRASAVIFFILYSIPVFLAGVLLLMAFANPGAVNLFPAGGTGPVQGYPENISWLAKVRMLLPYLVLPVICYSYSAVAFLSQTMRASLLEVINKDFIRTARAKGLAERQVIYKHALRNALFPVITVFTSVFPLAIAGSVIVETIFSIPGMGYETVQAVHNRNYPIIIAVFTITGIITLVSYLIADILYALSDPRVSFIQRKKMSA